MVGVTSGPGVICGTGDAIGAGVAVGAATGRARVGVAVGRGVVGVGWIGGTATGRAVGVGVARATGAALVAVGRGVGAGVARGVGVGVARGVGGTVRTTGGATRGVALGVGVGVGVCRVPGRLKCSRPGMVCGALCPSAAPEVPSSNVSASAPRMVEVPENPTDAPYPENPERHTTGWRRATSCATCATECNRARLSKERRARARRNLPLDQVCSGTP